MDAADSPSAILSRAADLIRDTAAKATPGPWEAERQFSHANVVYAKHDLIDSVGVAGRRLDLPRVFTGQIASRERARFEADARWIALMSPAVAPALEAWLRQAADELRQHRSEWRHRMGGSARSQGEINDLVERYFGHALDFARAVLGVQEDGENW